MKKGPEVKSQLSKAARDRALDALMGVENWRLLPKAFDALRQIAYLRQKVSGRAAPSPYVRRKRGRPAGTGYGPDVHLSAEEARKLNELLHPLWPTISKIKGVPPKYQADVANDIIEAFFKERLERPLPKNWRDQRPNKSVKGNNSPI